MEILYEADLKERPLADVLAEHRARPDPPSPFTVALVDGVAAHGAELDDLLRDRAHGWSLERMPYVDRNVLRLGLHELLHVDEVPAKVAIDEAVELVKELSTDSSPRFVNGVLAAEARDRGLL